MKSLTTASVAAMALLIGATAANALPVVGNPNNGGGPTLNSFLGNFDVAMASQAGVGTMTMHFDEAGLTAGDVVSPVAIKENLAWVNAHGLNAPNPVGPDGLNGVGPCNKGQGGPANCAFTEGADWISFANTGMNEIDQSDLNDVVITVGNHGSNAVATYKLEFTTGATMAHLGLWIYGDDTAEAFLSGGDIDDSQNGVHGFDDGTNDGRIRISPVANTSQGTCAMGVIGCQPGEQAFVEMYWLSPNTTYTLEIDMFQIGSGPMGILFSGGLVNVPEPASLALLGLGVLGMGAVRRRRRTH